MSTIVKIQASLVTRHPQQMMLVYNEDKSIMFEQPLTDAIKKWIGEHNKVYARASFKGGTFKILRLVGRQPW
jgi:hypothetical protein